MAIICRVYGLHSEHSQDKLKKVADDIRTQLQKQLGALQKISGHKVDPQEIFVYFPTDMLHALTKRDMTILIDNFPFNGVVWGEIVDSTEKEMVRIFKYHFYHFPNQKVACVIK